MMEKLGPGVYDGLPIEVYHGDCCTGPSISSTGLRVCKRDPAQYWQTSPLNPEYVAKEAEERRQRVKGGAPPPPARKFTKFATGSAAHLMLLEPELMQSGLRVVPKDILSSDGKMTTKAAKAFVAEHADAGRVVVTPDQWANLWRMVDALADHSRVRAILQDGKVEQSHIWADATGVFLKSRPDFMPDGDQGWIVDFKTTDRDDIDQWERAATCDHRLDMQAALQMWGAYAGRGFNAEGVVYIVQHVKTARIAIRFFHKDQHRELLTAARLDLRKGINAFAHCLEMGQWTGPWDKESGIEAPDFRTRQIERQLEVEAVEFGDDYAA